MPPRTERPQTAAPWSDWASATLRRRWNTRPAGERPAARGRTSTSLTRLLASGDFDDHVRCLDDADGLVADFQAHLVDRFGGHQADHAVRSRDHLDDGG